MFTVFLEVSYATTWKGRNRALLPNFWDPSTLQKTIALHRLLFMPHTSHIRAIIVDNALEWAEQLVKKFGIRNIRSQDYSFPGTFVPWTVRSMELSLPGTFVPGALDLSCRGPFVHLSAEQYLVWNSVTNRSVVLWQRRCTAAIHSQERGNDFLIGRAGPSLPFSSFSLPPSPFPFLSPFPPLPFPSLTPLNNIPDTFLANSLLSS